jgi:NADH-quinone oxidoreductase subunit M
MTSVDILLLLSASTLLAAMVLGCSRWVAPVLVVLYAAQFWALMQVDAPAGSPVFSSWKLTILGQSIGWRYNALSWYFAMVPIGAAFVVALYASGDWLRPFRDRGYSAYAVQVALAANVLSMLALLGAADFLSLFLGLELVGWSSFWLMAMGGGGPARKAARKYLSYAISGAMAVLGAMALIHAHVGSFEYNALIEASPGLSDGQLWTLLLLMGGGFAAKMGLLPFHLWQAPACAETSGPGSSFLSAVLGRMALYDFIVVFIGMVGIARLQQLPLPHTFLSSRDLVAWIAALTIVFPICSALRQNDARYLLTWLGVGQGGYMLLGLTLGDAAGTAGGLFHVLSFAMAQAALLMAVFAVVHRTGTSDLNKLGGLARPMPLTFLVVSLGSLSLAGLPPLAGFVSQSAIHRALLSQNMHALFVASAIGTLGTILATCKLIHKTFLGPPADGREMVREAPPTKVVAMLILSAGLLAAGIMPGPLLTCVAGVQAHLGLPMVDYDLPGIHRLPSGGDTVWVIGTAATVCGIVVIAFLGSGGRAQRIRFLGRWSWSPFAWLERTLVGAITAMAACANSVYRAVQPTLFLLAAAAAVAAWAAWRG